MDYTATNSITQTKKTQDQISPNDAIEMLKAGNSRFLTKQQISRDYSKQISVTGTQQSPFAVVLSCIDSRVPAEIVFDQGIGDIFSARVAGNFVNTDILGSIEYGCKVAGSKAVVVLGHSACGAVKGACDGVELGNITPLLANIKPAIKATEESGERNSGNATYVQNVVEKNVELTVQNIKDQSDILREMNENGEITIVGAVYDVKTGEVSWI